MSAGRSGGRAPPRMAASCGAGTPPTRRPNSAISADISSNRPPMTMSSLAARTYSGAAPRAQLIRTAFRLEWLTVAWMVVEAAIALASGLMARRVSLIAFGVDSLIELASAGVLIWRLTVELRRGESFARAAERRASRIGGALLFALAAYVVAAAGWSLWTRQGVEFSSCARAGGSEPCWPSTFCLGNWRRHRPASRSTGC